jgi:hypothetical protein
MLRVGVMLDSYTSSAWVAKVIEDIQSSGFARVELVILKHSSGQSKPSFKTRLLNHVKFSAFRFYERWDHKRNPVSQDALASTDISSLLHGLPSISVGFERRGCIDSISEDASAEIGNHNLDVLFYFRNRILHGAILSAVKYGVWTFDPGSGSGDSDGAPLFWELYAKNPITESSLRILADSGEHARVIYRSQASTDQHSLFRNRNPVYWKTAEFAMRRLRDLDMHGIEYVRSLPTYLEQPTETRRACRTPNGLQMFFFMARYAVRWLDERVASLRSGPRAKWYIAIRRRSEAHRFDDPSNYHLMRSSRDRFYADPFVVEKDGKTFLFFEDFRLSEGQAVISCCELDADGRPGLEVEVLRRPYHLSYPFVFEDQGEMYMVPETRGNRTVELYRAASFPYEWTPEAVLLSDVDVVDATIKKINGKYWMFAGVSNGRYSNCDELGLFYADALLGPWRSHPGVPLISDVQRARPAGALFYDDGRLIRPSQDCGKAYGYGLVFSEVLKLSETEYEERIISRLDPGLVKYSLANHTYNRSAQFEVVDRTLPAKVADIAENN